MLPHDAPVAFLYSGIVVLFVRPRTRHLAGAVAVRKEALHVMIDKLRPVVSVEATHAKGQSAEQISKGVASDVLPLVPYGSILRPVSEFVGESQSPNKASGEIALAVGHRVNAQSTEHFRTTAAINIGDGLFELSQALLPRLFGQRRVSHAVRCQSPLKGRSRDVNELEPLIIQRDRVAIFPGSQPVRQACFEEFGTRITLHGPDFTE